MDRRMTGSADASDRECLGQSGSTPSGWGREVIGFLILASFVGVDTLIAYVLIEEVSLLEGFVGGQSIGGSRDGTDTGG